MDITYDYYRVFYYAAKYGSFSRAAEALLKGQPNITKTINKLEAQLGCRLFVRTNKGITLTPEGERLYKHAEIAFESLKRAEREIVSEHDSISGAVSVATTEIGLYGALLPALTEFIKDFPNARIRLTNFNSPQSLEAVKNGTADFAVVTLHEKADSGFKITDIRTFREILCCKRGYKYVGSDIFASPYISINRSSYTYAFLQKYLMASGISKEPDIEVATAEQVLPLVKSGMGIGFVSEFLAREALESSAIEEIRLAVPPEKRTICFVENSKKALSLTAKKLKAYILNKSS